MKTAVSIELSQGTSRQSDRQTQDTRSLSLAAGGTEKALSTLPQRAAARAHCSNLSVVDVTQPSRRALPCYFPGNRHDARADAGIKAIPSKPRRECRNERRHRTVEHSAMFGFQNAVQHICILREVILEDKLPSPLPPVEYKPTKTFQPTNQPE